MNRRRERCKERVFTHSGYDSHRPRSSVQADGHGFGLVAGAVREEEKDNEDGKKRSIVLDGSELAMTMNSASYHLLLETCRHLNLDGDKFWPDLDINSEEPTNSQHCAI
jgi:hypothetical protein